MKLSDIVISKQNARTVVDNNDDDELKNLAESIQKTRLIERILLRKGSDDKYEVIAGQRRIKALELAYGGDHELSEEDYLVVDVPDEEAYMMSLQENILRKEYSPLDLNRAYLYLNSKDITDKEVARILGVTPHRLKRLANLASDSNRMPEDVIEELSKPPSESMFNDRHWDKIRNVDDDDVLKDTVDFIMEHETPPKDVPKVLKSIEKNHKPKGDSSGLTSDTNELDAPQNDGPIEYSHKGELVIETHDGKETLKVIGKGEDEEVPIEQYLNYLRYPGKFKCYVTFKLKVKQVD